MQSEAFATIVTRCLSTELDADEIVVDCLDYKLQRSSMRCLAEGRSSSHWLHSDIMNAYMALLEERGKSIKTPKCRFLITAFYTLLTKPRYSYPNVCRWGRRENMFDYDKILVPIHQAGRLHWVLGVIDLKGKQILLLDSLQCDIDENSILYNLGKYIEDEAGERGLPPSGALDWPRIIVSGIPAQVDSVNCGVFVLHYADCIGRDAPLDFDAKDIGTLRKKIIYDLCTQQITQL